MIHDFNTVYTSVNRMKHSNELENRRNVHLGQFLSRQVLSVRFKSALATGGPE